MNYRKLDQEEVDSLKRQSIPSSLLGPSDDNRKNHAADLVLLIGWITKALEAYLVSWEGESNRPPQKVDGYELLAAEGNVLYGKSGGMVGHYYRLVRGGGERRNEQRILAFFYPPKQ
jgi:hypothetical protein